MTDKKLIEKYLSEDLWEIASTYTIPTSFFDSALDLIEMILLSKSIDSVEEKQNWFNLLPMMNQTQVEKLRGILTKEKVRLAEIEQKYQKRKEEIKEKYTTKWNEMGYTNKVASLKEEEQDISEKDEAEAEELLSMI